MVSKLDILGVDHGVRGDLSAFFALQVPVFIGYRHPISCSRIRRHREIDDEFGRSETRARLEWRSVATGDVGLEVDHRTRTQRT